MTEELAARRCKPCEGGTAPLTIEQSRELLHGLHADWSLSDDGLRIERTVDFPEYGRTMTFVNAVADIATREDHHPVMTVTYGSCHVSYTTHAINGLSDNDFICAAKIDRLLPLSEPQSS